MQTTQTRSNRSDLIDNPSTRCACMLVLDTSGSMDGAPIEELNLGLQGFLEAVGEDEIASYAIDLGIITAGATVTEVLPFSGASTINGLAALQAAGTTPLGQAVQLALDRLEQRKREYKANGVAYYQPWLVIISDGAPTDAWQAAAVQSRHLTEQRRLVVMPVGVQGANLDVLGQFSSRPAKRLDGLKFREFFQWLSASMSRVSASNSTSAAVALPRTDSWDSI